MVIWRRCVNSVMRQLSTGFEQKHQAGVGSLLCQGQLTNLGREVPLSSGRTTTVCHQFLQRFNICSTRNLLAVEETSMVPVSNCPHQMRTVPCSRFLSTTGGATNLSVSDLTSISNLLPRLVPSPTASRLLCASLLLPPPHPSFRPLASLLSSLPDLAPTFSLLTALHHHPLKPSPLPLFSPLLSSFLANRPYKDSSKIFFWLCRPDSAHRPDKHLYHMAIGGFCKRNRMLEVLRVLREMARDNIIVGEDMRELVYRGLVQEARIDEARELDLVLRSLEENCSGDGFEKALEMLDRLICEWED